MENLVITNLSKSYGKNEILHAISLEVKAGEFISLLGPSGCGKTTTLRCIAGLERPDPKSGEIKLGTQVLSSSTTYVAPENRRFGMVFQSYAVWPHMNVADNVAFPLRIRRKKDLSHAEIQKKLEEVLDLVHLTGLENRFGHELSGGQQQRVALARALIMSPRLLLLDEPLSNLDALLREELRFEIQRLQKSLKLTTILVTHDQKEALSMSDRIVLLHKGKIEAQGTPQELYSKPPTDFVVKFLLGAHSVQKANGEKVLLVPRNWSLKKETEHSQAFKLISRLYL